MEESTRTSQTTAILFEFLERRAENDNSLLYCDRIRMCSDATECIRQMQQEDTASKLSHTEKVVRILINKADIIDKMLENDRELQEETARALEDTDSSQSWLSRVGTHLKNVIEHFFGSDEGGNRGNRGNRGNKGRGITLGGLCAIFTYCYSICKRLIIDHPRETIIPWLVELGRCLVVNFAKAKFYEWLEENGGWLKAVAGLLPSSPLTNALLTPTEWPGSMYLVAGLTLIGVWAYNRYVKN